MDNSIISQIEEEFEEMEERFLKKVIKKKKDKDKEKEKRKHTIEKHKHIWVPL